MAFIGKNQKLESFYLVNYLGAKTPDQAKLVIGKAISLYQTALKTTIQARYGLHQIKEAVEFYLKNQTGGKIVLKPSLTEAGAAAVEPFDIDAFVKGL
mmetsp:Transcript_596/g.1140  ORF Transcript_596/g.1140 Transcript_596/m.1140 type:complete len:98 (-) Transcript_596:45-338(-)